MLAFVPFGYFATTRLNSVRDLGYLVVSSWLPAWWILVRQEGLTLAGAAQAFALGYLAFICLYEIGYLINDAWDAARHRDGRERTPFPASPQFILPFVAVRLAGWAAIAAWAGWWQNTPWLVGQCALLAALALHNLVRSPSLRLSSFMQLAMLRFILPISALLSLAGWLVTALAAALLYVPLRYLAYADSKGLLAMPERRARWFPAASMALSVPLIALVAVAIGSDVLIELWLWLLAAHGAWALLSPQPSGANP
ncbi:hypothetical protein [Sphingomonas jaspsi]|uniref:hypothetical protein n=1 Tax=Sphingomonas jaspsi TaxID=392409 RepID=UPI0004B00E3F|nr:hypothetical protein [Sphingomonas jaspsi]